MSWQIALIKNTVGIPSTLRNELFTIGKRNGVFWNLDDVTSDGKLSFNSDHAEHMDYLSGGGGDELLRVLVGAKVTGDICFGSLEGDNKGEFWGYRFDGEGGVRNLSGRVIFDEGRVRMTAPAKPTYRFDGFYDDGDRSNKEYHLWIDRVGHSNRYMVQYSHGKRGGTLKYGTHTKRAVAIEEARSIYWKIRDQKLNKGYEE